MQAQKTPDRQHNLSKMNNAGGLTFPGFKLQHRAMVTTTGVHISGVE